jgi:hypothetical protein
MGDPEPELPSQANPKSLTHRDNKMVIVVLSRYKYRKFAIQY